MESSNCLRVDFIVAICLSVLNFIEMENSPAAFPCQSFCRIFLQPSVYAHGLTGIRFALEDDWENAVF